MAVLRHEVYHMKGWVNFCSTVLSWLSMLSWFSSWFLRLAELEAIYVSGGVGWGNLLERGDWLASWITVREPEWYAYISFYTWFWSFSGMAPNPTFPCTSMTMWLYILAPYMMSYNRRTLSGHSSHPAPPTLRTPGAVAGWLWSLAVHTMETVSTTPTSVEHHRLIDCKISMDPSHQFGSHVCYNVNSVSQKIIHDTSTYLVIVNSMALMLRLLGPLVASPNISIKVCDWLWS